MAEVELRREDEHGNVIGWKLVDDGSSPTGVAEASADFEARQRLQDAIDVLEGILEELGGTLTVQGEMQVTNLDEVTRRTDHATSGKTSGSGTQMVFGANPMRTSWLVRNIGENPVELGFVSNQTGIELLPGDTMADAAYLGEVWVDFKDQGQVSWAEVSQ